MDSKIMELRLKQWIPIFEEQAKSGLNKQEWCEKNEIKRAAFFKWQRELRKYLLEKDKNKHQNQLSTELEVHTTSEFVELPAVNSSVRASRNDSCDKSGDFALASTISIRYGEFIVDLNDDVNELFLSKVLKVVTNVY